MNVSRAIALPTWTLVLLMLLGGCMHERSAAIPSDAMRVSQGDKTLSYRTDAPGTIYVYNQNDDKMLYSGRIDAGQIIAVEPDHDRITLDGRPVLEKGLNGFNTRSIFFRPERR